MMCLISVFYCLFIESLIHGNGTSHGHTDHRVVTGTVEYRMLDVLIRHFPNAYDFEACDCKIAQIMDSNIVMIEPTRHTRDGGRDAVDKYRVVPADAGIEIEFALEVKRYQMTSSVGVKETSRLISRIKNRQFGIFVTTSFVGYQAYKEIVEDQHPVIILSGIDIVKILMNAGINSEMLLQEWLDTNF